VVFRSESELYPAVKAFLEARGYEAKGEVGGCDVVATRPGEPPTIVELKLAFTLALVLQGVDRLSLTDQVYLAVPRPRTTRRPAVSVYHSGVRKLCRRLGLGLLTVATDGRSAPVEVVLDPVPYRPRKAGKRLGRLLGEHARRVGDPSPGGVARRPIMTAYRQEALRCALLIRPEGQASLRALRATGLVPGAARILQRDVYGWFRRVGRGTYGLTDRAREDLARYAAAGTLPGLAESDVASAASSGVDSGRREREPPGS
jgi:hypothetical protein